MGDEDDRREFIKSNLTILSESTVIGTPLVLRLYQKGLIDVEEKHILNNSNIPDITRAMTLYTSTAYKWDHNQFEEFKKILKDVGNSQALQVFTNAGADYFLTNEQVQLLRQQGDKSDDGCYEGLSLDEETTANKIVHYASSFEMLKEGKLKLCAGLDRREFIRLFRQFNESLKNKTIWWNPRKPKMPSNYIRRKVYRMNFFIPDGQFIGILPPKTLLEVTEDFVLLIDPPGMGKSSEVTNLEQQLRTNLSDNRIILRTNLNEVQGALSTITDSERAPIVVCKLAPLLPPKTVYIPGVRLVLLLDGLDEVCPKHEVTMINLLRILRSSNDFRNTRILLTSRPHLRTLLEAEFKLNAWSLLPLTQEEQDSYIKDVGVPEELLSNIRSTLTRSVSDLLGNPLMLFMLVDVLKSGGSLSAADVNIYDLYSRFVEAKHELHCVKKLRMEAEANYTDLVTKSMLSKNLPFYFQVALVELCRNNDTHLPGYSESVGTIVKEPPSGTAESFVATELLSCGLLIEDGKKSLVFKHRSFAEFFYAKLLTQEGSIQQVVRETLFGLIYSMSGALENVEAFVRAALLKGSTGSPSFSIGTKWLLIGKSFSERSDMLKKFVEGKLFSLCAKGFLISLVNSDPDEGREAFRVLVDTTRTDSLIKLYQTMSEDTEWSRIELFKLNGDRMENSYPPPSARLMVAIAINFEDQELLSAEEVCVAIRSPHNKLIYTVASSRTEGNWDFVEKQLEEGQVRKLFLMADDEDFQRIVEDKETTWKLVANLSEEEIYSLLMKNETRVTDVVGRNPQHVFVIFGDTFISGLAKFRGKFNAEKGKTVFELSANGCEFALDFLWGDLLQEKEENKLDGPVRVALREALGRSSTHVFFNLWGKVRRRKKCPRAHPTDLSFSKREWEESDGLLDWIFGEAIFGEPTRFFTSVLLPLVVRYSGNYNLANYILLSNAFYFCHYSTVMEALRTLILRACCKDENSPGFPQLTTFIQKNLQLNAVPGKWKFLAEVLEGATKEQVNAATPKSPHSGLPPFDVSVGQVLIRLIPHSTIGHVNQHTWVEVVGDVIRFTRCCELLSVLEELKGKLESRASLEMILKHRDVIFQWVLRFSSVGRKKDEDIDVCGLNHLLSFYFSVFGFNLEWMKDAREGVLVRTLPDEVAEALENNPQWAHLFKEFKQLFQKFVASEILDGSGVLDKFAYRTEGEWERLFHLIGEKLQLLSRLEATKTTPGWKAAPAIRVLIKSFGVEGAKNRVSHMWEYISTRISLIDQSQESLGSLLHSAIEPREMEEVEKRAWPGLITWRNPLGKNALQVALESCGKEHPITLYLHSRIFSKESSQVALKQV